MMKKYIYYFVIFCLIGCKSMHHPSIDDVTYNYIDINNNSYKVTLTQVHYTPVTSNESSSGNYNGGTARAINLNDSEFKILTAYFDNLILDKETHQSERSRMTSLLKVSSKTKQQQFILSKSDTLKQLESYLHELLK